VAVKFLNQSWCDHQDNNLKINTKTYTKRLFQDCLEARQCLEILTSLVTGLGTQALGMYTWYSASSWNTTSKALRYGTCSQRISPFYLHTPRSYSMGMSHTCLCLISSYNWYSFTDPGWMEGWVGLGGWLRSETVYLPEGIHPSHY